MKFCNLCGSGVSLRIPDDDNLPRYICDDCETIHYQNPKIVTGCIPEWNDQILLCKRAIEPRYGLWTLPAGFMENNESLTEAAKRETMEEANSKVSNLSLYAVYSIPHISQVYMMFRATMDDTKFSAGAESLEVELFTEQQIPWDQLAFPVIIKTLKRYYEDKKKGVYELHVSNITHTK